MPPTLILALNEIIPWFSMPHWCFNQQILTAAIPHNVVQQQIKFTYTECCKDDSCHFLFHRLTQNVWQNWNDVGICPSHTKPHIKVTGWLHFL